MSEVSLNHFDYPGHLAKRFKELLSDEAFADVTLVRLQGPHAKFKNCSLPPSGLFLVNGGLRFC